MGLDEPRRQRERALEAFERLRPALHVGQHAGAIEMRHRQLGVERDGAVVARDRVVERGPSYAGWRRG